MPTRLLLGTLVVLILAGAGGTAYFSRQADQHAARAASLEQELAQTRAEAARQRERADKLTAKATELDTQLGHAKTRKTATETRNSQLARELSAVKSSLTERQQREVSLLAEIESLRQQIKSAEAGLPASSAALASPIDSAATTLVAASGSATNGPPPASSATLDAQTPSATSADGNAIDAYRERIAALELQLTQLLARALAEPPPADFQVVRVGPRDAFVVVDFGTDQGAAVGDELTLCRGTYVVARVRISDARARFSVAHVLPATLKRQLQTGDFVLIGK